jgi:hypothetical protein
MEHMSFAKQSESQSVALRAARMIHALLQESVASQRVAYRFASQSDQRG